MVERATAPPRRRAKATFYTRWIEEWWFAELAATAASCLLTIVLTIILWRFDGQPVPNFGTVLRSGITLGTVTALLSTLIVASALAAIQECLGQLKWLWFYNGSHPLRDAEIYDRASRGPLGSARLLARLRVRHSPVSSIGAFLMITQLLITPLVQQAIVYSAVHIPDLSPSAIASVPISRTWYDDVPLVSGSTSVVSGSMSAAYTSMSAQTKGAIMNGFYSGNVLLNDTTPLCSSGNCTFPNYSTLGICGYAANITAHLTTSGNFEDMTQVSCLPGDFCIYQDNPSVGNAHANVSTTTEPSQNPQTNTTYNPTTAMLNFTSIAFNNFSHPLTDVYVIYLNDWEGYNAVEFVLDWCVPTFSSQMIGGVATTSRVSTVPLDLRYQESDEPNHLPGLLVDTVDGTDYTVELSAHATIQRYFQMLLNGKVLLSESYLADNDQIQVVCDALNLFGSPDGDTPAPTTNLSSMHMLLDNIATSMTNVIRTSGNESSTDDVVWLDNNPIYISGTPFALQNVVHIYWGWVVPLILFSALSLIFVVLVASTRGRRGSHHGERERAELSRPLIWKTSQLAALRGLDRELQRVLGGLSRRGEMDASARSVCVRLIADGDGWRLVRADEALPVGQNNTVQKVQDKSGVYEPVVNLHNP